MMEKPHKTFFVVCIGAVRKHGTQLATCKPHAKSAKSIPRVPMLSLFANPGEIFYGTVRTLLPVTCIIDQTFLV